MSLITEYYVTVKTQIDQKRYDSEMSEIGVTNVLKLGIAFSGKKVRLSLPNANGEARMLTWMC